MRVVNTWNEEYACYIVEVFVIGERVPYLIYLSNEEIS